MRTALFVGSFDPFTNGHLDIIRKAIKLCDKLIVGIGKNENKVRVYNEEEMQKAISQTLFNEINQGKIEICKYNGLTGEFAKERNVDFIVRGLRDINDFTNEESLASFNKSFFDIDTIYIRADKFSHISSTLIKALINANKSVEDFVPKEIYKLISKEQEGLKN